MPLDINPQKMDFRRDVLLAEMSEGHCLHDDERNSLPAPE
jgi:hypothetical protein